MYITKTLVSRHRTLLECYQEVRLLVAVGILGLKYEVGIMALYCRVVGKMGVGILGVGIMVRHQVSDRNAVGDQLNTYITKTLVSPHRTLLKCYKAYLELLSGSRGSQSIKTRRKHRQSAEPQLVKKR